MNGTEAKRMMGVGTGTLAQKVKTHCDPFEPVQPVIEPESPPAAPQKNWWDALVNSGQVTIWPR